MPDNGVLGQVALDAEDPFGVELDAVLDAGGLGQIWLDGEDPLGVELDAEPEGW